MHIEYLHKDENEDRRHKSHCIYILANGRCLKEADGCHGSAHCVYYSENIERLRHIDMAEYERKVQLLEEREERIREKAYKAQSRKVNDILFKTLLTLPFERGFQFGIKRFKKQLRNKGYIDFTEYAIPPTIAKICKLYNDECAKRRGFYLLVNDFENFYVECKCVGEKEFLRKPVAVLGGKKDASKNYDKKINFVLNQKNPDQDRLHKARKIIIIRKSKTENK